MATREARNRAQTNWRKKVGKKRVEVYLPEDAITHLDSTAKAEDITRTEVVARAIQRYADSLPVDPPVSDTDLAAVPQEAFETELLRRLALAGVGVAVATASVGLVSGDSPTKAEVLALADSDTRRMLLSNDEAQAQPEPKPKCDMLTAGGERCCNTGRFRLRAPGGEIFMICGNHRRSKMCAGWEIVR